MLLFLHVSTTVRIVAERLMPLRLESLKWCGIRQADGCWGSPTQFFACLKSARATGQVEAAISCGVFRRQPDVQPPPLSCMVAFRSGFPVSNWSVFQQFVAHKKSTAPILHCGRNWFQFLKISNRLLILVYFSTCWCWCIFQTSSKPFLSWQDAVAELPLPWWVPYFHVLAPKYVTCLKWRFP